MRRGVAAAVALFLIGLSVVMLERGRSGLDLTDLQIGTTPATLARKRGSDGPLVVVAHGFAGSRQLMQAWSLSLARSGYRVLSFDFEGHGRNPVPMSGDVAAIDGTTALMVAETRRVIAAGRALPGEAGRGVAVLGHSMATDIIVRAAEAEAQAGTPVKAVVAISMFSAAVTAREPPHLLVISGEWEGFLRAAAYRVLQQVDPNAPEPDATSGVTATKGPVTRRVVVAPGVEHVGVLFSATAIRDGRDWLDAAFGRSDTAPLFLPGGWILLLLAGIVSLFQPVVALLPPGGTMRPQVSNRRFLAAVLIPAAVVPLAIVPVYVNFLPVLVADYLMVHLALVGILQLGMMWVWQGPQLRLSLLAVIVLVVWGVAVFGLALDRYAASFVPTPERLGIIAVLCLGTVPFMVADACVSGAGQGALWRRVVGRVTLFVSLGLAALLDPDRLLFVLIILPVIVLFFLVHGLMGRWVARRCGPVAAGTGLGLCLAWALGVSFPLFNAG